MKSLTAAAFKVVFSNVYNSLSEKERIEMLDYIIETTPILDNRLRLLESILEETPPISDRIWTMTDIIDEDWGIVSSTNIYTRTLDNDIVPANIYIKITTRYFRLGFNEEELWLTYPELKNEGNYYCLDFELGKFEEVFNILENDIGLSSALKNLLPLSFSKGLYEGL